MCELHETISELLYNFLRSERGRQLCTSCVVHRPIWADDLPTGSDQSESVPNDKFDSLMLTSTFCLVVPGVTPFRLKFIHAILAGCLPVVVEFPSYLPGFSSWWKPRGAPHIFNVPFPDQTNYSAFVVGVPWRDAHDFPEYCLQKLLGMEKEDIHDRQVAMQKIRDFVMYDWSGSRPDAFTALLDRIVDIVDGVAVF